MKLATLTAVTAMLMGTAAMAADQSANPLPDDGASGRPSAVLSESQCKEVWDQSESSRDGDNLTEAQAEKYVLNFQRVDSDNDRKISHEEFKEGCSKGWVQALGDVEPIEGDTDSEAPVNPGPPDADIN
jgi:hypothetical protein